MTRESVADFGFYDGGVSLNFGAKDLSLGGHGLVHVEILATANVDRRAGCPCVVK